jgi:DNA-binding CsgD family transcriptional regulator
MSTESRAVFSRVESLLDDCLDGTGGLAVISGPVGAGKTHLLRMLAQRATEAGALCVLASGSGTNKVSTLEAICEVVSSAGIPLERLNDTIGMLEDALRPISLDDHGERMAYCETIPVMAEVTASLLEVAEHKPLVVCIDDAHYLTDAPLQYLTQMLRPAGRGRILLVASVSSSFRLSPSPQWTGLLSQAHCYRGWLSPLSPQAVAEFLAAQPARPPGLDAAVCHQITGGNPRLLTALIEDCRAAPMRPEADAAGTVFGHAVLACLSRGDPLLMALTQALAVAGGPVGLALLSDLLETDNATVKWAVEAAAEAGLLEGGWFRHPQACAAVLASIGRDERTDLHRRVAHALYHNGDGALEVARHLIAGRHVATPWAVPILREAAEQALGEDASRLAMSCLHLAERGAKESQTRANVTAALVRVKWRLNPVTAEHYLPDLLGAVRGGHLDATDALTLVNCLAWYGRPAEASEALLRVGDLPSRDIGEVNTTWYSTQVRLGYLYPGFRWPSCPAVARSEAGLSTSQKLRVRAADMIQSLLTKGLTESALQDAEDILEQLWLSDDNFESLVAAVETMTHADYLERAAFWCDSLLRQAKERLVPTWSARLSALGAMISLRQGNLTEAELLGRAALSDIPASGLGVHVGIPLSVLCEVAVCLGQLDVALSYLRLPVPEAMSGTLAGLHYTRARGKYFVAEQSYAAAIDEFGKCGQLMTEWGLDFPGIVPWRTDLEDVYIRTGVPSKDLALGQLGRLGPFNERTWGITLRALAAASDVAERPAILARAIGALEASGCQAELAAALADMSHVRRSLADHQYGREILRRARHLVRSDFGGRVPPDSAVPARPAFAVAGPASAAARQADAMAFALSDAERRVASLAAQGYTNRQIAHRLYITVSTVEQHLTRVYKKLRVKKRSELPGLLPDAVGEGLLPL